ncbi:D-2-hydroxyacid dehydrogenase [Natronospirillum operosum]|uniref:D-2-hydroxyacid dehydrogenase n=1 Tax=Natronospirillum operosum TaxID=2759953 RepID=A0A4Z0WJH7_9GAMM|nr:D-2-hydroxyacid dehydrogenase [Natronospirillum operosum]TGG96026.1 D-2-hydroxyacid dehydrogenase [Natronospirillum operosum]
MSRKLIAVTSHRREQWRALLEAQSDWPTELVFDDDPDFEARAGTAEILFGDTPEGAHWLPRLPSIRWFHTSYSGVDALLPHRDRFHSDLLVTNTRDIAGPHIAEYILGHVLNITRMITEFHEYQKAQDWQWQDYDSISESACLILGTGAIGQVVAERLTPWFARVDGLSRSGEPKAPFARVSAWPAPPAALGDYRVVVNTLPRTPDTEDSVNADFLHRLAPNAIFINTGRGETLVDDDLLAALNAEPGRRAVLDVFRDEPLPQAHPFWHHPQITVTPHVAALSRPDWVLPIFRDNLDRYLAGEPLRNRVDLARGY